MSKPISKMFRRKPRVINVDWRIDPNGVVTVKITPQDEHVYQWVLKNGDHYFTANGECVINMAFKTTFHAYE